MRRAWYFIGVGSKARDAKEVRVFGLRGLLRRPVRASTSPSRSAAGHAGLRAAAQARRRLLRRRRWPATRSRSATIADAARTHDDRPPVAGDHAADARGHGRRGQRLVRRHHARLDAVRAARRRPPRARPAAPVPSSTARRDPATRRGRRSGSRACGSATPRPLALEHGDVLAGVDLELAAGTSTALVGVNGAGKSTLVSLLVAAARPDRAAGSRSTGSTSASSIPARWQRAIALMPQDPVRYPLSAYDNVAFGALEHADDRDGRAEGGARLPASPRSSTTLPHGWDTVLSRELPGGVELSGGQWQRLALARALFADAPRRARARARRADRRARRARRGPLLRAVPRDHRRPDHARDLAPVRHRPPRATSSACSTAA